MSADSNDSPKHLYLVDGSGYIFRAFFALPPMNRADGTPTNAVFGVTSMLLNLIEQTDADYVAVIFDAKRINFRNDIYPDYKGHRPDAPEELMLFCGMAIGHSNPGAPVNQLVAEREPLDHWATFVG